MLKGRKLLNGKEIYIKPHLSVWKRHLWPGTVTFQIYIDAKVIAAISHIESDSQLILTAQLLICARVHCDSIIWGIFPQLVNIIFNRESIKLLSLNRRDYVHYVLWAENYILQLTYPRSFNFETYVTLCTEMVCLSLGEASNERRGDLIWAPQLIYCLTFSFPFTIFVDVTGW